MCDDYTGYDESEEVEYEEMNREDEYFDLADRSEAVCDAPAEFSARVIGRFVSSLKVAIAGTTNEGLRKRLKHVRGRLIGILSGKNEKAVAELLRYINKYLGDAEQNLALAMQEGNETRQTIEYFDFVEGNFSLAASEFRDLETRKYLIEFAKKRQPEIDLLKEKLAQLRVEYKKRPEIVDAARARAEAEFQRQAALAQAQIDEQNRQIDETLDDCTRHLERGNLGAAGAILNKLIKVGLEEAQAVRFLVLMSRWEADSIKRGRELATSIENAFRAEDMDGARHNVDLLAALEPRVLAKVLGAQPEMQIQRLRRRCNEARRKPAILR